MYGLNDLNSKIIKIKHFIRFNFLYAKYYANYTFHVLGCTGHFPDKPDPTIVISANQSDFGM